MKRLLAAHRFFCRQSQHYILGNWNCYERWWRKDGSFNRRKWEFVTGFPVAYIKFMYYTLREVQP